MTTAPPALPGRTWNKRLKASRELACLLLGMADMRVDVLRVYWSGRNERGLALQQGSDELRSRRHGAHWYYQSYAGSSVRASRAAGMVVLEHRKREIQIPLDDTAAC